MKAFIFALFLATASAIPQPACKPQYAPFPVSCVDCKGKITPQNVPFHDISKLWGVWYTVQSEKNCAIPHSSCTQVNLHAQNPANVTTKLDYEGFFCKGDPTNSSNCMTAVGDITPTTGTFSADQPPYQLRIVEQVPFTTDFYFAATDGDASGNGITAMVTLSCPHAAQAFSGSQAFILSRTPVVTKETMATLMERAKLAIPNFSEHSFHAPVQLPDKCHYKWPSSESVAPLQKDTCTAIDTPCYFACAKKNKSTHGLNTRCVQCCFNIVCCNDHKLAPTDPKCGTTGDDKNKPGYHCRSRL